MPKKKKAANSAAPKKAKSAKPKAKKNLKPKAKKSTKPKVAKAVKPKAKKAMKPRKAAEAFAPVVEESAQVLGSETVFEGPLFRVLRDRLIEPNGIEATRDIVRHNGSVVILAIDGAKNKRDPWVVIERQFRHAAGRFMWELPAGKLEPDEDALLGAKRELEEETGYRARKWKPLVEYYASPGFLGESMKVFVAEGLVAGDAHPEDDEKIEFRLVKLSELIKLIELGAILDGKTLTSVLLFARKIAGKRAK
ncbi:MAG: NUDIX hydrolase [Terracidiphilus sp.]|jgi:ADP-ribose pyrophosphatase